MNVDKFLENKKVLQTLINERKVLIEARNKTYNNKLHKYEDDYNDEFRSNENAIYTFIDKNFDDILIEDILNATDHCGLAPCLINNDNGMWAITGTGMQNISIDSDAWDFEGSFFVEKDEWRDTVREAVRSFIDELVRRNDEKGG